MIEIQNQSKLRQVEATKSIKYLFAAPIRKANEDKKLRSDEDDSMVSDNITSLLNRRNINFPIEEHQSESVLDSMYESNYPGYDSTKQKSPLKTKTQRIGKLASSSKRDSIRLEEILPN